MFKQAKLTVKVIAAIVATLVVSSAVSFFITQHKVNQDSEEAFRDRLRQVTGMASSTRSYLSANVKTMVPDGNFKTIEQVPVVAAWKVAQQYVDQHGMTFHTPSLNPRNPRNQPTEFERRALEAFQKDPALTEYSERAKKTEGTEVMQYAQPVRISEDCLLCHGSPAGEKDPFGYAKEGMRVGDLRAAFAVEAPTRSLVEQANANAVTIFFTSLLSLLATGAVIAWLSARSSSGRWHLR